jgi:hypothetical protein
MKSKPIPKPEHEKTILKLLMEIYDRENEWGKRCFAETMIITSLEMCSEERKEKWAESLIKISNTREENLKKPENERK